MSKLLWTLSKASYLALLELLPTETNWEHIAVVTHCANCWKQDRLHVKRVARTFPKFGDKRTMMHRRAVNLLNKTKALHCHLRHGRHDARTDAMVRKLYPSVFPLLPQLHDASCDIEKLREKIRGLYFLAQAAWRI